ncbi:MAG: hypothetical protein U9P10_13920, partial [Thermodesulfobacteriota bacterium]|nr:hypothetical protein [Thermodesulfobacteriota bacterium]
CLRTNGRRSPIFSLAGKKSSVVLVPDRQPLGAAVFKKLDDRVTGKQYVYHPCLEKYMEK